jgi:hypothetical protein
MSQITLLVAQMSLHTGKPSPEAHDLFVVGKT